MRSVSGRRLLRMRPGKCFFAVGEKLFFNSAASPNVSTKDELGRPRAILTRQGPLLGDLRSAPKTSPSHGISCDLESNSPKYLPASMHFLASLEMQCRRPTTSCSCIVAPVPQNAPPHIGTSHARHVRERRVAIAWVFRTRSNTSCSLRSARRRSNPASIRNNARC
jgi:hypothetical protein